MTTGYLLDTNVVSELRKGDGSDAGVRRWFDQHRDDELWLSTLVIGELRRGVELLRRRDATSGAKLGVWLDGITDDFADRVLPIDTAVCERWAVLSVPDPLPVIDGLLAATALTHGLVFVTRNVTDIERTGTPFENPFAE